MAQENSNTYTAYKGYNSYNLFLLILVPSFRRVRFRISCFTSRL